MNGRSSDWLLISDAFPRSRYVESGSGNRYVSEILSEFHSSGNVRDLHTIPFSFPPRHGERKTKSGANITVNPEKQRSTTNYFRETALQTPETTIFVAWIFHFDIPQKTIALHCPWLTISPGSVMPGGFWSVAAPAAITAAAGDARRSDTMSEHISRNIRRH